MTGILNIVFDAWACDQGFANVAVGLSLPTTVSVREDEKGGLTIVGTVVLLGIGLIIAGAVVFLVNREGKVRRSILFWLSMEVAMEMYVEKILV